MKEMDNKFGFSMGNNIPNAHKARPYDYPVLFATMVNNHLDQVFQKNWPKKWKSWEISLTCIIDDNIGDKEFLIMGPHRDNRNRCLTYGLHISGYHLATFESPDKACIRIVCEAVVDLYRNKFGMDVENEMAEIQQDIIADYDAGKYSDDKVTVSSINW